MPAQRRRIVRVFDDSLLVELERRPPLARVAPHLVCPEVQVVGTRRGRHILFQHAALVRRQRNRKSLDELIRDLILYAEQIADRHLDGLRPQDGGGGDLHELCRHTELLACSKERPEQHRVDLRVRADGLEVGFRPEPQRRGARSHDQRLQAGQAVGDGVGKAEGKEVRIGISAEHAERQHDQPRHGAHHDRRCPCRSTAALPGGRAPSRPPTG